jgi:AraC-like DNA-binding protein
VAQLLRFERATELLAQDRPPSWAELAFRCGYFDQSHLIHDFRAIVGVTPTEYIAPAMAA